ncbi:unnamed protein product [Peronospora destructor]|uniref:CCHC-type domain-containing protein n=1 Tax=Peronospora destructor TaxID=86335 RepID=A0AAV0SZU7_9STRA|nr:unnamed protein product [Peronospora destructor]
MPRNTEERMVDLLTGLAEQMAKLEESQEAKEHPMDRESSVFGSAIGQGQPMKRRALEVTPPRARSPCLSPGTYFGVNQPGYARAAEHVEMAQAPHPGLPQHYVPPSVYQQRPVPQNVPSFERVPDARQRKLNIRQFDGKELYQGLGSGFLSWGKKFVREVSFAERASEFPWSEDVKIDVLGHNLAGMAENYYSRQVEGWWQESPTLDKRGMRRGRQFGSRQHCSLCRPINESVDVGAFKPNKNRLFASNRGIGALRAVDGDRAAWKDIVNNVRHVRERSRNVRKDARKCYSCGKPGHIKSACPETKVSRESSDDVDFVLAVDNKSTDQGHWILDSGSSRHLVNDERMLEDSEGFQSECIAADGGFLRITKRGSVTITTTVQGKLTKVRLLDVQFAENLERNIISYGILEAKGFGIAYMGRHRVVSNIDSSLAIFDVEKMNNVLIVRSHSCGRFRRTKDVLMTVLAQAEVEVSQDVQKGSLMHFHRRLAHLNYDTIIRMAKDPACGIQLTDLTRANCLACTQGKQTKNPQSKKDTGENSPVDVIGAVICSDLKGPMAPRDRLGNRYMVNFVDHRTNYCRVFLAKSKDVAAQKFKHFMAFLKGNLIVAFTCCERMTEENIRRWTSFARTPVSPGRLVSQETKPVTEKLSGCTAPS